MRIEIVTGPREGVLDRDEQTRFDILLDCRWIRNTMDLRALRDENGTNPFVQAQVSSDGGELLKGWFEEIDERVYKWAGGSTQEVLRIGCFCTFGMHRSVAVGTMLSERLAGDGFNVGVEYLPSDGVVEWIETRTLRIGDEEVDITLKND